VRWQTTHELKDDLLDHCLAEPFVDYLAILGDGEDNRERKALQARLKTAELLGESRRQHWHSALHEIDTSRPLLCVTVQSSVGLNEMRDIGDVNTDVVAPILIVLDGQRIVEVLGSFGIDGEDTLLTQIFSYFELTLRNAVSK
jgi:hypothetical protein